MVPERGEKVQQARGATYRAWFFESILQAINFTTFAPSR
jgi:hypothetical protein